MSNYTKLVNFAAKDALPSGDAAKVVRGTEINTEFTNIATAVNSKADVASPALTGTPTAPTASSGSNTTQIATTAFVTAAVGSTSTDLVLDTSPQLGGNLDSNGSDIEMADNDKIKLGTSGDLEMYHNGTDTVIADTGTGILKYTSSEDGPAGVVFEIENTSGVSGAGSFVQFNDGTGTPAKVGGVGGAFYVLSGIDNSYVLLANPLGATTLTYAGIETLDTTAAGIEVSGTITATGGNSTNWNTAYSWGDHAGLYSPAGQSDFYSTWNPVARSTSTWYTPTTDVVVRCACATTGYYTVQVGSSTTVYKEFGYKGSGGDGSQASAQFPVAAGQYYRIVPTYSTAPTVWETRI